MDFLPQGGVQQGRVGLSRWGDLVKGIPAASLHEALLDPLLQVFRLRSLLPRTVAQRLMDLTDFIVDFVLVLREAGQRTDQAVSESLVVTFLLGVLGLLVDVKLSYEGAVGIDLSKHRETLGFLPRSSFTAWGML
jgi:hypothetical protein